MKSGAEMKSNLDAAHAKAIKQQRANTPVPGVRPRESFVTAKKPTPPKIIKKA